jgi:hypothetical protein
MKQINIFYKASFGKLYKTRGGKKAIFVGRKSKHFYYVIIEGSPKYLTYYENGRRFEDNDSNELSDYDIIGEYDFSIRKEKFRAPGDMDKECIALCKKLNSLSNIKTVESCCGHLKEPYRVFFMCDDFIRLGRLFRCVNRNYSDGKWCIEVDGSDVQPCYEFMLTSKEPFSSYEEMNESINSLLENIDYWENQKFDDYFKCVD